MPDHPTLLKNMLGLLKKGGTLAVQVPMNFDEPIHQIIGEISMWSTTYYHVMESHDDILEWYRGTGLRPYLEALNESERPDFIQDIREQVKLRYPAQKNGKIIFRFPRFFFTARR